MGLTPIRTLIVDDEPIARQVLREELGSFADVEVCGEAGDGQDALVLVARLKPELMLLDLHMPGLGGFEVIQRLPNDSLPMVVIVTAYDQHALRAFEAGALDYLLKPVSGERLEKAIERARAMRGRPGEIVESLVRLTEVRLPEAGVVAAGSRRIAGKSGQSYHLLNLEDVLAFQAEREIVWILTGKQRYMATQNLRAIEARGRPRFYRVHQTRWSIWITSGS